MTTRRLALAVALAAALVACQRDDATNAPAPETAATPAAEAATPAPTTAASPAAMDAAAFWARVDQVLADTHRSAENKARDAHRHPRETLEFFGFAPGQTVVEITPGGGWYTEILAPALKGNGVLIAALVDPASVANERAKNYYAQNNAKFRDKLAADAERYGEVRFVEYPEQAPKFGADGSADAVYTFRNVHNWTQAGNDAAMFKGFFDVLKPGGVLGIEEHRAAAGTDAKTTAETGYVSEDYVIGLATAAGFQLAAKSEVNANPKDTRDHPEGVWTLPPTLALKDQDKDKYLAIGESDRMTLKFVKPADAAAASASPAAEGAAPAEAAASPAESPSG